MSTENQAREKLQQILDANLDLSAGLRLVLKDGSVVTIRSLDQLQDILDGVAVNVEVEEPT